MNFENVNIIAKYTHYEITNYKLGMVSQLEDMLSIWNERYFRREPYYFYDENEEILYVPRGIDPNKLRGFFNQPIQYDNECNPFTKVTFNMTTQPRDNAQRESIRFLMGRDEYAYTYNSSQLVLSLPGGGGKTYCMVAASSILGMKEIIVTHTTTIREQWVQRILEYTNIPKSSIVVLESSSQLDKLMRSHYKELQNHAIYITSHSLLRNYMKANGFHALNDLFLKLGIGIKVVDEAHKEFKDILMIDYATNVCKNYYLTATFARGQIAENIVFQQSFDRLYKLKKDTEDIMGGVKNVVYIANFFKSDIPQIEISSMRTKKNFSIYRYIELEFEYQTIIELTLKWMSWLYDKQGMTGKVFVLSPKKETCDELQRLISAMFPEKTCCSHHSSSKVESLSDYDIICATAKMLGTGTDIDDLKAVINLEPIGNAVNTDQLIHRLMRGKDTSDAFFIEVMDKSVPNIVNMYRRRRVTIDKFAKKVIVFDPTIKKK